MPVTHKATKSEREATVLTVDELIRVGKSLYGENWASPLFRDIGWTMPHGFKIISKDPNPKPGYKREMPLHVKSADGTDWVLLRQLLRDLVTERMKQLQETRWMLDGVV